MGFNCGIVGLPNVGKSTLFNALTATEAAESANFPFTTIEPNVGRVGVPDDRLTALAAIAKPPKVTPTQLEFVDIAGLVKGASKGEGLGNQFLGNIREVDAIIHVLRCFEDSGVTHVAGGTDPVRDAEWVNTELLLADLDSLERRSERLTKKVRGGDKESQVELKRVDAALALIADGKPARQPHASAADTASFRKLGLLTAKPVLYVCNVDEVNAADGNGFSHRVADMAAAEGAEMVVISARIEHEIATLDTADERAEFLAGLGLAETGLAQVIRAGYRLLDLITFFTVGPKEARAWTIVDGATAVEAAAGIHTDFARGFICAETVGFDEFASLGGEQAARDAGRMRQEGREYRVRDGDILLFRFNV